MMRLRLNGRRPMTPNDPENPDNTATDEEVEDILDAVFGDES